MFGITAFEWSVGFGAWVAVAIGSLTYAEQTVQRRRSAWITFAVVLPLLTIGVVYTFASLFMAFVRLFLFVVFAMLHGEVLLTSVLCVVLATGIHAALALRETTLKDPAAASPAVLAAVRRVDSLLEKARAVLASFLVSLMARGLASSTLVRVLTMLESSRPEEAHVAPVATEAAEPEATETEAVEPDAMAAEAAGPDATAAEATDTQDATLTALMTAALSLDENVSLSTLSSLPSLPELTSLPELSSLPSLPSLLTPNDLKED